MDYCDGNKIIGRNKMKNWVYYMQEGLKSMWTKKEKKKTKHKGDESTVGFWLYMKSLYKEK